jgi:hypothetical protein
MSAKLAKRRCSVTNSVWLRLALLIVAWQGPIPWCHAHDTGLVDPGVGNVRLLEHLRSYHAGESLAGARPLGWHFHVDFPHQPTSGTDSTPLGAEFEFSSRLAGDLRVAEPSWGAALSDLAFGNLPLREPADHVSCRVLMSGYGNRFFDAYASSLPLPLRFGVIRC